MGLSGLEPPTSRLSGVRSNRLSYKPISIWQPPAFPYRHQYSIIGRFRLNHRVRDVDGCFPKAHRHQKTASRALALHALEVSSETAFLFKFGGHLLSHTVSSAVPSAVQVFTIVFGMGTGVAPERIATKKL